MKSLLTWFALLLPAFLPANERADQYQSEGQLIADLGNGFYQNPILVGTQGDVSICRKGEDFYMTHTNAGTNKLLIWHSRDLVNWQPLDYALTVPVGRVWAIDLDYYEPEDMFYLFLPVILEDTGDGLRFTNMSMKAKDPAGPWEGPFDLGFGRIDPGHVADDEGNRYVYVDKGYYHKLAADGKTADPEAIFTYEGWPIPEDWVVECECLESPKFFRRGEYYYMISAQGGTGGPSTAHMAVIARSLSPTGPWENSPYNPLVRTRTAHERWWRQGHGDIVDDIEGNWWMMYTAYERDYENFRKVNLLLPIEWTHDDWPILKDDAHAEEILRMPPGENVGHGLPLSDDFESQTLARQWHWLEDGFSTDVYKLGEGKLRMQGVGEGMTDASRLFAMPTNHAYELTVEVEIQGDVSAGIFLSNRVFDIPVGVGLRKGEAYTFGRRYQQTSAESDKQRIWVRLRNYHHDISYYHSEDGISWKQFNKAARKDQSDEIFGLYSFGKGHAVFRNFRYQSFD